MRAAGAGTEQAIDIQDPQWNPVQQGQKGEGRKGVSCASHPAVRGLPRGPGSSAGGALPAQQPLALLRLPRALAPLVLVGGTQSLFPSIQERDLVELLFCGVGDMKLE